MTATPRWFDVYMLCNCGTAYIVPEVHLAALIVVYDLGLSKDHHITQAQLHFLSFLQHCCVR